MTPAGSDPARARWIMWGIPALLFLIAFFHRVAPGVLAKDLMQSFNVTGAIVGLLSSTYFYAYAGLMVPAGILIDAFGVRRVVAIGGAVMGAGTLAMGMASGQGLLFAGRFAVGLGATVTFIGALKIAATWFPLSHFATLSAVTATVGVIGSLVGTYPLAGLVGLMGWRSAFVLIGLVTVALAVLCFVIVRDRPAASAEAPAPLASPRAVLAGMFEVLANRHTWPPFLAFFFFYVALGNLMLWLIPCLRDLYGLSATDAALYATAMSFALLFSGPLTGFLSDRVVKRRKLPYVTLSAGSFALWVFFVATLGTLPLWALYALFFAMGVTAGSFVLTWPLGREVNPPELSGVAVAVVNLGGFLGVALTQAPFGAVLDRGWTGVIVGGARVYPLEAYRHAFAVCALAMLLSALTALLLRETRGRNVYEELKRPAALSLSRRGPA